MDTQKQNPARSRQNTVMAILAYLGILVIIPYIVAKNDPFVKFHIKQGLILLVVEVAVWVLGMIWWFLWPLFNLIDLITLVFAIIGIVNVAKGREKELPWVGHLAAKFSI